MHPVIAEDEPLLSPKNVRLLFRSKPDANTVRWWMTTGVKIGHGENQRHILLRYEREGVRLFTRLSWVNEFKLQLNRGAK